MWNPRTETNSPRDDHSEVSQSQEGYLSTDKRFPREMNTALDTRLDPSTAGRAILTQSGTFKKKIRAQTTWTVHLILKRPRFLLFKPIRRQSNQIWYKNLGEHMDLELTLRKIAIWLSKNCPKRAIFSKKLPKLSFFSKNCQKLSFFSTKLPLAILF